jgi:hypothetical protein
MDDTWRTSVDNHLSSLDNRLSGMDGRLTGLEKEVHGIKGAMDWMKVAFALLATFTVSGFALLAALTLNLSNKVDGLSGKLTEEFRAQRTETAAQTSAIANAITATKQQAPQVILVPAPQQTAPRP